MSSASIEIKEVLIYSPLGARSLQVIVVGLRDGDEHESGDLNNVLISNSDTVYRDSWTEDNPKRVYGNYLRFPDVILSEDSPRMAIVNNLIEFNRVYTTNNAIQAVEWGDVGGLPAANFSLNHDDVLHLRRDVGDQAIVDMVAWGNPENFHFYSGSNDQEWANDADRWDGSATCPIPAAGQSLKRVSAGGGSTHWQIDSNPSLGHSYEANSRVWITAKIPDLIAKLSYNMPASTPAGYVAYVDDAFSLPSSGSIQIGVEQMAFEKKVANYIKVSQRGANGTQAYAHSAGEPIYIVEAGEAHLRRSIDYIRIIRRPIFDDNDTPIVPERFSIYGTVYESHRAPMADDWKDDWQRLHVCTDNRSFVVRVPMNGVRLAAVAVVFYDMTDGGRVKVDELEIIESGNADEVAFKEVVTDLMPMINKDKIIIRDDMLSRVPLEFEFAKGSALDALRDLMKKIGGVMAFKLDGSVVFERDQCHPLSASDDVVAALNANTVRDSYTINHAPQLTNRQYSVTIKDLENFEIRQGVFPLSSLNSEIKEVELALTGATDFDAAMYAQMLYNKEASSKSRVNGSVSGVAFWMEPNQKIVIPIRNDDAVDGVQQVVIRTNSVTQGGSAFTTQFNGVEWRSARWQT